MDDFDPDSFLEGKTTAPAVKEPAKIEEPKETTGFDPDAFLGENKTAGQPTTNAPETTPMPQFAVPGETGFSASAVGKTLSPMIQAGKNVVGGYVRNPIQGIVDVGAVHMGLPPPYATTDAAKGLYNTYQGAKESLNTGTKIASRFGEAADLNNVYHPMRQAIAEAAPGVEAKISEIFRTGGGNQGVKTWLTTTEEGKQFLANPATKSLVEKYLGAVPTVGQQVGKVVGPVLRTAGKVLGPAGLAMNAYDAAQYAQAAELGKRLAGGQGGIAQQAFRNMQHNSGAQYQLQPQEAANVLASNDQATINLYGGPQRLQAIAGAQSPMAAPTTTNFIERMRAMAHQYGMIKQ